MNIVPFVNVILLFVLAPNDQSGEAGDSETNGETVTKTAKPRKRKTADTQDGEVSFLILFDRIHFGNVTKKSEKMSKCGQQ